MSASSSRHYQLSQRILKSLSGTRVVPLAAENVQNAILDTPADFLKELCDSIRNAKDCISLASLYIGTGASSEEAQLLDSLSSSSVPSQTVLMDSNRGLRPVKKHGELTSSAQSVQEAIKSPLRLYQALKEPYKSIMPSPLNEVIGVFHIKSYIVDDTLILSGANLSQEYFSDRQDRYIKFTGSDLVDFYKELVDILSQGAAEYPVGEGGQQPCSDSLLSEALSGLFAPTGTTQTDDNDDDDSKIVAHAIPTFGHPTLSFPFASDTQQLTNLLNIASDEGCEIRMASAYLNPTPTLLKSLSRAQQEDSSSQTTTQLLTAGPISHGFAPKPGVQRTGDFVPLFFAAETQAIAKNFPIQQYQRPGWTFHAKGVWILDENKSLVAAVVGSGNYGHRSEQRDLESNCILVFPHETSDIQESLLEEWDRLCVHAEDVNVESEESPQFHIKAMWPLIRSYF